ncbi:MAG: hypothetical protein WBY28_09530 [Nitrososphaeraceae archaeon]
MMATPQSVEVPIHNRQLIRVTIRKGDVKKSDLPIMNITVVTR